MATKTKAAPAKAKTAPAKSTAVTTTGGKGQAVAGVSAAMLARMQANQGQGVSKDQADNLIPLIYVLQAQSPQVLKKNAAYIEGAEAGDFWLRNAAEPIIKGEEGMEFQPCFFDKDWVEWVPRDDGGGYVGRHRELPDDAKKVEKKNKDGSVTTKFMSPRGTEYVETRYEIGHVLLEDGRMLGYVIPFTSTGHNVSKGWMMLRNQQTMPNGAPGTPPAYSRKYKLTVVGKSNKKGDWFAVEVADLGKDGWVTEEQYMRGEAMHNAFAKGEKQVEAPEINQDGVVEGHNGDM